MVKALGGEAFVEQLLLEVEELGPGVEELISDWVVGGEIRC